MGPVALLVFKTSVPANTGLVSSTLTRLRHPFSKCLTVRYLAVYSNSYMPVMNDATERWGTTKSDLEPALNRRSDRTRKRETRRDLTETLLIR